MRGEVMANQVIENKVENKDEKVTISGTVDAAMATEEAKIQEDNKTDEKKVDDEKKITDEQAKPGLELSAVEEEQAKQLFYALKDPKERETIIDFLATKAGYKKIDTPAKAEETKETIVDTLKKALGPELDYLADKLGPAIDRLVDEKLKTNTADIRANLERNEEEKLQSEAARTMQHIAKDVFKADEIPDNILHEMNVLMDKLPPSKDMSVTDYIENIYYSVAGRLGVKVVDKIQEDRRSRNRIDAPSRLASEGGKSGSEGHAPAKTMGITEAIKLAEEQLENK